MDEVSIGCCCKKLYENLHSLQKRRTFATALKKSISCFETNSIEIIKIATML